MSSVGIRELRQNASEVVRRVEAGEVIDVTVNGRPAARLVPLERQSPPRPKPRSVRGLTAREFLELLAEHPDDRTGWADEIYASRDNDPLYSPWGDE